MMCSRRSATPDVATAKSRPVTTSASRPGCSGSAIPIRHIRSPLHWTSPPPLTLCPAGPAAVRIAAARSTAHPLTYPEGSNLPPGVVVKYPRLRVLTAAHASSTSASSGTHCSSGTSPRPNRLTSLSSRYGEKVASTQCSQRTARPRGPSPRGSPARAGTSKETTVPITCSACLRRSAPIRPQERLSSALCSDWM